MSPANQGEEAALSVAQSRGWIQPEELNGLREAAGKGPVLPLLAARLDESQRQELTRVYHEAAGSSARLPRSEPRPAPSSGTVAPPPSTAPGFGATPAGFAATPATGGGEGHFDTEVTLQLPPGGSPSSRTVPPGQASQDEGREIIGDYVVLEELGRGGMGVVYRARHRTLDREVALKVLLSGESAGAEEILRFQQEGKAAARLEHPNVVRVLDQGQAPAGWFIAMELIRGRSIQEELRAEGPFEPREGALLMAKLARAIHFAHEHEVLHRDLKPHNVLLDEAGEPRLTDFGLAKLTGSEDASLTRSGAGAMGTPAFMSPEQASEAKHVDARSDVYGLGATLFAVLTGDPPFVGETYANLITSVLIQAPPDPSELEASVPSDLSAITLRCLEKDPADRYPSALALAEDLEAFLEERAVKARPANPLTKKLRWAQRHPEPVLAGLAAFLMVVGIIGFFVLRAESSASAAAQSEQARLAHQEELSEQAAALEAEKARLAKAREAEDQRQARGRKAQAERVAAEQEREAARAAELARTKAELERLEAERENPTASPPATSSTPVPGGQGPGGQGEQGGQGPGGQGEQGGQGPGDQGEQGPGDQREQGPGGQGGQGPGGQDGQGPGGQGGQGPGGQGGQGPGGQGGQGPGGQDGQGPGGQGGQDPDGRPGPRHPDGRPGPRHPEGRPGPRRPDGRPGPRHPDGRPEPPRPDGRPDQMQRGPQQEDPQGEEWSWQVRRLAAISLAHAKQLKSPFLAANWRAAFREAKARRVPVVVFWIKSESEGPIREPYGDPEFSEWLFQEAVVLVGIDDHHRSGRADSRALVGPGPACSRFHYTTCEGHQSVRTELKHKQRRKRDSKFQVLIFSPEEELLLESRKVEQKQRKTLKAHQFDRNDFDGDVLERAQKRVGMPVIAYDVRPLKRAFLGEVKALFGSTPRKRVRGLKDLVRAIKELPKRVTEDERPWVERWLSWRCQERTQAILRVVELLPRRQQKIAYDRVLTAVRSQPQLVEFVDVSRTKQGQ